MPDPLLVVDDFVLARARPLVAGASWSVARGQRVLLTGPSGSGKSSFLLALAGLAADHAPGLEWKATISGHPSVGFLFQNPYSQLVCPTLEQELAFGLENAGWSASAMAARVAELKQTFGLESLGDRAPWTFSGGEAQRVALASVLAPRPDLVLLDEPLGFLDDVAAQTLVKLASHADRQAAWVVVDHDPEPWRAWADVHYRLTPQGHWSLEPIAAATQGTSRRPELSEPLGDPVLELSQLRAGYGRGPDVVKGLDLRVHAGETVALVGPSGAGKSTIFRCLAGQIPLRGGSVKINGQPFKPRLHRASPFGWVPQVPEHYFVYPTVRQEWGGAFRFAQAFGLEALAERHPFTLSEGEKRRLNLASALADTRPLLLLDEPQYGLDAAARQELEKAIGVLQAEGRSLIIISHEPAFCQRVAHRVVEVTP